MKKSLCLVLFFSFCRQPLFSQTKTIDSLRHFIDTVHDNEKKLTAIFSLNEQTINADTVYPYVLSGIELALHSKNKNAVALAAMYKAYYYARKNIIDSGITIMNDLVSQYKTKTDEKALYLRFAFFRAKVFDRGNRYSEALTQLYDVIETAENEKDTLTVIQAKTGIGWVLIEMEEYKDALKWLYEAMQTSGNRRYYKNYGALYSNIATAYNSLNNKDSAIHYINIAIQDARENDNLLFLATALSMQAKILIDNNTAYLAEAPLNEVVEIRKKMNDPFYIVFDMSILASYYAKNHQPQKGIAICKEGISIAKKLVLPSQLMMIYKSLAENYKAAGNNEEYGKTLEYIISLKDSFNSINSAKMLSELHAAYETRKKEKTIAEQKLNLTTKNYFLFGSAIFALMAIIIAWQAFQIYKRRQKINMEIAIEKEKLTSAQAVKDAEEHERKRIAADFHDNLGVQANAILYGTELLQQENGNKEHLVNDLHDTAKDMLLSLRETLWAMKTSDVPAADVWVRIISFCNQLNRYYPSVKISTVGNAPENFILSSVQALHSVLIVQEAVNNATRHAAATTILIESAAEKNVWQIEINDNGKGFDLTQATEKKDSYGLNNMKERAAAAGLQIHVVTKISEGTNIKMQIPITGNPKGVLM